MGGRGSGGHNKIEDRLKLSGRYWEFTFWLSSVPRDWLSYINELNMPTCISPLHDQDFFTRRNFAENPDILTRHIQRVESGEKHANKGFLAFYDIERVSQFEGEIIEDYEELSGYIKWCESLRNHFLEEGTDYFPSDNRLPLIFKDPHRHVVIDYRKTSLNTLIKELGNALEYLGIDPMRDVRPVLNMDGFVPYLCHLYEFEKVHYPIEYLISLNGFNEFDYIDKDDRENEAYRERALKLAKVLKTCSWGKVYKAASKDDDNKNLAKWIWKHHRELDSFLRSFSFDDNEKLKDVKTSDNMSSGNTNL